MPQQSHIDHLLAEHFIIWEPRDIVGGDIYYLYPLEKGSFLVALVDCTGHGVPGAFMTMIASTGLRKIIDDEKTSDPASILSKLNVFVKTTLQQDAEDSLSDNGLDAVICRIDAHTNQLTFAGANLPLFYHDGKEIQTIAGDRQSLGYKRSKLQYQFTNHHLKINETTIVYLTTDGILDQKGASKGFPMGRRKFTAFLSDLGKIPLERQAEEFHNRFSKHQKMHDRTDDVTLIAFRPMKRKNLISRLLS